MLMVVESTLDRAVHWMSPTDSDGEFFEHLKPLDKVAHQGGIQILLDDGSIRFCPLLIDTDRDLYELFDGR